MQAEVVHLTPQVTQGQPWYDDDNLNRLSKDVKVCVGTIPRYPANNQKLLEEGRKTNRWEH